MSDNTTDDLVLIERSQRGDRAAFDQLVWKYQTRAYQYAYRLTQDSEAASDIVADAFVRTYNALPNFRAQSAFTTWLYRIVTNCYLDMRKKDRNRKTVSLDAPVGDDTDMTLQVESDDDGPDVITERNARERLVQKALRRMPEYQQTMLTMFHIENRSYEEIAEVLDLPIGTVKSRLNRARLSLREHLSENLELFDLA
ncbi:MAG: sigma-70 family RNA polymerase sigma factor [Chthonomonas sp.]|nr:sigma-70 family RNA polymerase sigma factor [Chthonomonas sp.]